MKARKILLILLIILCITGCKGFKQKTKDLINNASTLDEYIMAFEEDYVKTYAPELKISNNDMAYTHYNINCSALKDAKVIDLYSNYFILENGDLYDLTIGENKSFSNGEQCKKRDDLPRVIKASNDLYLLEDNRVCTKNNDENGKFVFYCDVNEKYEYLLRQNDIKKIIFAMSDNTINADYFYVIKTDGNVYRLTVVTNSETKVTYVTNSVLFLNSAKYGKIKNATMSYNNNSKIIEVQTLETENGFYILSDILTDECSKYEDVICEKGLRENDILKKYKSSIKFINSYLVLTNDNMILPTSQFIGKNLIEFPEK